MQRPFLLVLALSGWLAQPPAAHAQNPAQNQAQTPAQPADPAPGSPRPLALAEAVQLAQTASKDLKRNEAAQRQAAARLQQAKNGVVPGVQVSSTFLRLSDNVTPFSVNLPGAGEVVLNPQILNQSYNSLQVRQLLWAGGKVRLGIEIGRAHV